MSIIFSLGGNFWIEAHTVILTGGGQPGTTFTLDRPGDVLGFTVCASQDTAAQGNYTTVGIQNISSGTVNFGDNATQLIVRAEVVGSDTFTFIVLVFMRKSRG